MKKALNQLPSAVFPSAFTPMPSNPVTMTDAWNHQINTPQIDGTRGGQREGQYVNHMSLESLAIVQRSSNVVMIGGVEVYQAVLLVKGRA